ncbi:MAG: hypothetical protein KTR32_33830 [Granulosicoccus sp.]|nr:hypothetical protein [Granulosicoccus sp.]
MGLVIVVEVRDTYIHGSDPEEQRHPLLLNALLNTACAREITNPGKRTSSMLLHDAGLVSIANRCIFLGGCAGSVTFIAALGGPVDTSMSSATRGWCS